MNLEILFEQVNTVFEQGNILFEQGIIIFEQGNNLFQQGNILFQQGDIFFEQGNTDFVRFPNPLPSASGSGNLARQYLTCQLVISNMATIMYDYLITEVQLPVQEREPTEGEKVKQGT